MLATAASHCNDIDASCMVSVRIQFNAILATLVLTSSHSYSRDVGASVASWGDLGGFAVLITESRHVSVIQSQTFSAARHNKKIHCSGTSSHLAAKNTLVLLSH